MALCCIGGVCVPYSAILPVLLLGIKWLMDKIMKFFGISWGSSKLSETTATTGSSSSNCCSKATTSTTRSMTHHNTNTNTAPHDNATESMVRTIASRDEWDETLATYEWVMVKFTAVWCQPCHAIQPVYEQLAQQYYGKDRVAAATTTSSSSSVMFVVVDVDELDDVASLYQVAMMPTFVLLHQQQVVGKMTGSAPAQLQTFVKEHLLVK